MRSRSSILAALVLVTGCSAGGGGTGPTFDPSTWNGGMTGPMELRLVDAPNLDVKAIVVTITHVEAHVAEAGWITLASTKATVDLLSLQGGTFASLGFTALPAGHLTQIRLFTDDAGPNYVITPDGAQHELKIPSGDESGIKLKLGLEIPACASGNITLDFDGHKSIWAHATGHDDLWILRPVVRLEAVSATGTCGPGSGGTPPGSTPPGSTPPGSSPPGVGSPPTGGSTGGSTAVPSNNTLPTAGGGTTPNSNPVPIGSGSSLDCGGAPCSGVCSNGTCIVDGAYMY